MNSVLNKKPCNAKGEYHGTMELHHADGELSLRSVFVNGREHGLTEAYGLSGNLQYKGVYVNGVEVGYWKERWGGENDKNCYYINI